ncbi:hypothetical protein BN11_5040017 [Nostocoides australiense Ben110]|uniref:Uncharacterized protein n=1 Tax=Nostocoides australiense Ben110 TaxID=1193182 RepID=W6K0W2_9MICO|nr:hypothetical protein [Tetrasphaera australiensis]MCA0293205.1 hypothetical protein [Actinomycetota bacterium]CCH73470.1 hypothetical protein BN11_2800002 [Tetrasphaera australiensis Ben110]CCH75102.1 hypothetical protein BN11_5040017 [Tetrasphaera australiensis Ben110]
MTATPAEQPQDFLVWLATQSEGRTASELSDGLAELVRRVKDTGKKGSISLTISVEPMKGADEHTMIVKDSINLKLPEFDRTASVYFSDKDGGLHRNDPRQLSWDTQLREVPPPAGVDPATGEIVDTPKG